MLRLAFDLVNQIKSKTLQAAYKRIMTSQWRPVKGQFVRCDLRCFSVADFNWPQAAMMSSPRGVRIGLA